MRGMELGRRDFAKKNSEGMDFARKFTRNEIYRNGKASNGMYVPSLQNLLLGNSIPYKFNLFNSRSLQNPLLVKPILCKINSSQDPSVANSIPYKSLLANSISYKSLPCKLRQPMTTTIINILAVSAYYHYEGTI